MVHEEVEYLVCLAFIFYKFRVNPAGDGSAKNIDTMISNATYMINRKLSIERTRQPARDARESRR